MGENTDLEDLNQEWSLGIHPRICLWIYDFKYKISLQKHMHTLYIKLH